MTDLVEFLRARLDEDEQAATAAFSGQADPENGWGAEQVEGVRQIVITPHVGLIHEAVQADHVARWNPARVLREVKAKRLIITEHYVTQGLHDGRAYRVCTRCSDYARPGELARPEPAPCATLRLFALPYVDHPDYEEATRSA